MRKNFSAVVLFCVLAAMLGSCSSKVVEKAKEDIVVNIITSTKWTVTKYLIGPDSNVTAAFAPYEFQFNKDNTVFGMRTGMANDVGSWAGDATAKTIVSNFPGAADPLKKLNGTWVIFYNTFSVVKARREENGVTLELNLGAK